MASTEIASIIDSQESGISLDDPSLSDKWNSDGSQVFTEAERDLEDLNFRLANCFDKATQLNFSNSIPEVEKLTHTQDLSEKVDQLRAIYDKDIARVVKKINEINKTIEYQLQTNHKLSNEYNQLKKKWSKGENEIKQLNEKLARKEKQGIKAARQIATLNESIKVSTKKYVETKDECSQLLEQVDALELKNVEKNAELILLKEAVSNEKSGRLLDREVYLKCEKEYLDQIKLLEETLLKRDSVLNQSENFTVNKLNELRQEFENEFLQHFSEIQSLYTEKCETLEAACNHRTSENIQLKNTLEDIQPKYQDAQMELVSLRSQVASLECQLSKIKKMMNEKEQLFIDKTAKLDKLLDKFTVNYQNLSSDYNVSIENQLLQNTQLQTLKKLIEAEESRLSILPTDKPLKRKSSLLVDRDKSSLDIDVTNNSEVLLISDWSYQYDYICLKNISDKLITLEGYFLEKMTNIGDSQRFYLPSNIKIDSNQFIRIFTKDTKCCCITSKDIIAKNISHWFDCKDRKFGSCWKIALNNADSKELSSLRVKINVNEHAKKKYLTIQGPINTSRKSCAIL